MLTRRKSLLSLTVGILTLVVVLTIVVIGIRSGLGMDMSKQRNISFDLHPTKSTVIFSAEGKGGHPIYTMDRVSKKTTQITNRDAYEQEPTFSADGSRIAFASGKTPLGESYIYTCAPDGTGIKQWTNDPLVYDWHPSFSSDGSKLLFCRAARNRDYSLGGRVWDLWDVFELDFNSGQVKPITNEKYSQVYIPMFSHDGKSILYAAYTYTSATANLYSVSLNDKSPPHIVSSNADYPSLSADGKSVAFISDRTDPFNFDVWIMRISDGQTVKITSNKSYNTSPVFTKDGKSIVFLSDKAREQRYELWQVNIADKKLERLADNKLFDDPLRWQPR